MKKNIIIISKIMGALVVLILLVGVFMPSLIKVERTILINSDSNKPFSLVNNMGNWIKWGGPWHEEDMDFTKVIQRTEGATKGVGSVVVYD